MNNIMYVYIVLVHKDDQYCDVQDRTGGRFAASFRQLSPAFRIPMEGEVWSVYRQGLTWQLGALLDRSDEYAEAFAQLEGGDTIIASGGKLVILAPGGIELNDAVIGAPFSETIMSDGGSTYVLTTTPLEYSLSVYYGVDKLNSPADYSISGQTLTLTADVAAGIPISCSYQRTTRVFADSAGIAMILEVTAS